MMPGTMDCDIPLLEQDWSLDHERHSSIESILSTDSLGSSNYPWSAPGYFKQVQPVFTLGIAPTETWSALPRASPPDDQRPLLPKTPHKTLKEERRFPCHVPGCHKVFTRRYNLAAHIRCHNGKRLAFCVRGRRNQPQVSA